MNTKTIDARRQLIDTLSQQLKDKQSELAKFTINSKAKAAIQLREEIAKLSLRIQQLKAKLAHATVVDNDTGVVTEKSDIDIAMEAFHRAKDNLMKMMGVTSTRRAIIAYLVGFMLAAGTGYLLGHVIQPVLRTRCAAHRQ